MGLAASFILNVNRRAVLAMLAVATSVAYALIASAATGGLAQSQEVLAADLQNPATIAVRDDKVPFRPDELPATPDAAYALTSVNGTTYYTPRTGVPIPDGQARAGTATGLGVGRTVTLAGQTLRVNDTTEPLGISSGWIGVPESTFTALGGASAPAIHLAAWNDLDDATTQNLQTAGFQTVRAPAAVPFFEQGADQIVQSVTVTVLASTLVIGFLTAGFILLEIQARRQTLATIRLYAGRNRVRSFIAGRGLLILAAGHAIALVAVALVLALLSRALDQDFTPTALFLTLALASTLGGGLAGILVTLPRAARRLEAKELQGPTPRPGLPRILRPVLTSWRNLVPLTIAALVLAASLGVLLGAASIPNQLFGQADTDVIAGRSNNPLRGQVDGFVGQNLHLLPEYDAASPESFAPTIIKGQAVLVRGVNWDRLNELDDIDITRGRAPTGDGEAAAGARVARLLGLTVGDTLHLPAAYTPSLVTVQIVGTFRADGILNDEILTTLPTTGELADLPPTRINLVRFRAAEDLESRPQLPQGIQVVALATTPIAPVPNEPLTVRIDVVNYAGETQTRRLTVRLNDAATTDAWAHLDARSSGTITLDVRTPPEGLRSLAVNPTITPTPQAPAYRISAPDRVTTSQPFTVTVTTHQDQPQSGVTVRLDAGAATTNSQGQATLTATQPGNLTITATGNDGRAARPVHAIDPEDLDRSRVVTRALDGPRQAAPGVWRGTAHVENIGGREFEGRLPIVVDGEETPTTSVRLGPGAVQRVPISLQLDNGTHALRSGDVTLTVTIRPDAPTGPQNLDDLLQVRLERAQDAARNRAEASSAFLGETYENLTAALTVLVAATALHAGLIILVAVFRETEQRARTLGIMTAVGADQGTLRIRSILDHAPIAIAAGLLGTLIGLGAARLAAEFGILSGFGHALLPRLDLEFILRLVAVTAIATAAAAAYAVTSVTSRHTTGLLEEGPRRTGRTQLRRLLEARR